jgi:hypothetical protein
MFIFARCFNLIVGTSRVRQVSVMLRQSSLVRPPCRQTCAGSPSRDFTRTAFAGRSMIDVFLFDPLAASPWKTLALSTTFLRLR